MTIDTFSASTAKTPNRWLIAVMGTALQLCLGTVYAWSFFQNPLMGAYGWSNSQVALTFSVAICFLGLAAAVGGVILKKYGPRKLAMLGGLLFGCGYLIAAAALHWKSLLLFYFGYGCVGGFGLGLGYVTPVATAAKWFPDRKGLVTGMVVMGFGFGALLMSKAIAPELMKLTEPANCQATYRQIEDFAATTLGEHKLKAWELLQHPEIKAQPRFAELLRCEQLRLVKVFGYLGIVFLVMTLPVAACLRNPPPGFAPKGYVPPAPAGGGAALAADAPTDSPIRCLLSGRFAMMWLVFFCNITAGIGIISLQSPMMQDLWHKTDSALPAATLATYGATLIAISSLFNGVGRLFWGALSDRLGRAQTFRLLLLTQIVVFLVLIKAGNPWLFGALICYVLLCYGGGFGSMPSFVLDVYGPKMMAVVYGVILTAWSAAGVAGPLLFAGVKDHFKALPDALEKTSAYSFAIAAGFLAVGLLMSLLLSNKPFRAGKAVRQP